MNTHKERQFWDYSEAVWVVYDALCEIDEKSQFPLVKTALEAKQDVILFPMEEFDSVCQTLFGNRYSDFYKAIIHTNRLSCFVMSESWGKWDNEEEYFVSESQPADFIKDESVFFEEAIQRDGWLSALGFSENEIKALKQVHAKHLASKGKEYTPHNSKLGCLSREKSDK